MEKINKKNVKPCSCPHEYQDSIYGKNKRLHTITTKQGVTMYRCTVCLNEKNKEEE